MHLRISHTTTYSYDAPVRYALQRVRLVPLSSPMQKVRNWMLAVEGAREEVRFADHFGNDTRLLSVEGDPHEITITASGEVDTQDMAGVLGAHRGYAPLWLFTRSTDLTAIGEGVAAIAAEAGEGAALDRLHRLVGVIGERVAYETGTTGVETTAEGAIEEGKGVCQDHAHIFIAAARSLGFPARYVSGYLLMEGTVDQVATHAWAEAHVDSLGWVGFDVSNGISPDERYVRLALGLDYRDAMPVSGIRTGQAAEQLAVHITVEQ